MTLVAKDRDAFGPVRGMRPSPRGSVDGFTRLARVSVLAASCLWAASVAAQTAGGDVAAAETDPSGFVGQMKVESSAEDNAAGEVVVSPVQMTPVIEENPVSTAMPLGDEVSAPAPAAATTPARASASTSTAAPASAPTRVSAPTSAPTSAAAPASARNATPEAAPAPAPARASASEFAPAQPSVPVSQPPKPIGRVVPKSDVQIGRVAIAIPSPKGFAVLSPAEIAAEKRVLMATDSGDLLLLGLVPSDLAQRLQGGPADHRSLKVYTPRVFSSQSVSPKAFQSLRQSMRQQIVDAASRGVTGSRLLDGMGGIIPGPERRSAEARIQLRPVHADSERALMYSVLATDMVSDENGNLREETHVATTAAVLLNDRVVFMTAQAPGAHELDWSRAVMRNWVSATLAANEKTVVAEAWSDEGSRAKSSALDTLLQVNTGIEWLRAGQIIGVLLVIALLMYLRKLTRGR